MWRPDKEQLLSKCLLGCRVIAGLDCMLDSFTCPGRGAVSCCLVQTAGAEEPSQIVCDRRPVCVCMLQIPEVAFTGTPVGNCLRRTAMLISSGQAAHRGMHLCGRQCVLGAGEGAVPA